MRTPLRTSPWLAERTRAEVRLKLESLQPTFSYKIRGAFNAVLRLTEAHAAAPPLVTASAGNHGRALASAAAAVGLHLTAYVPRHAPRTKLEAIASLGADLRLCGDYDESERRAKEHGASGDALFISPYSHPDVIAGAGTIGLEILEDWPEVEAIVVPIGGGGLVSGIALAVERSGVAVHGVEVEASSPFTASLAAGHIVTIDVKPTLADGLAGNLDPDTLTFDLVRRLVTQVARVSEQDLRDAMRGLITNERLITEGAGAAGVGAVLRGLTAIDGRRTAVVISGANVDSAVLKAIL